MGWEIRGERGPELVDFPKGSRVGIPHTHGEYVPGCFRCDLSRDELRIASEPVCVHDVHLRSECEDCSDD